MTTIHNDNAACCSIPPVQVEYTPKGTYKSYGDFDKVYVTGDDDAKIAIVVVYDIFGYFPQTLQGADIVAQTVKAKVLMPDFFRGKPFDLDKFPPKTDEEKSELQTFFGTTANLGVRIPELNKVGEQLKSEGVVKVGAIGYCWGGKVAVKAGSDGIVDAVAILHPALLSADDGKTIKAPVAIYASKDENQEDYDKWVEILKTNQFSSTNQYKKYDDMIHGWAAARGDLEDPKVKEQYEDVYSRVSHFFKETLTV